MDQRKSVSRVLQGLNLALSLMATVFLLMIIPRKEINDAICIAGIILVASCVWQGRLFALKRKVCINYKESIFSVVLSVIFLFQLSITRVIPVWMQVTAEYHLMMAIGMLLVIITALLLAVYSFVGALFAYCSENNSEMCDGQNKYGWHLAVIIGESLLFLGSTFPGIWIQADVDAVFQRALAGEWNEWHTIGYQCFVNLCMLLWKTPFAVNVVQTVVWILLNWYVLDGLSKINRKAVAVYTVMLCCSITPFLYLEVMYKDTVFSMGILALAAVLFNVVYKEKLEIKDMCVLATVPLFSLLCRHAGALVTVVPCVIVVGFFILKKLWASMVKMASVCAWYIIVFGLVNYGFANAVDAVANPGYIAYGTPMAMIAGAAANGVEFSEEDAEILEKVMPVERWGECYNKYWVDDISREWGKIGGDIWNVDRMIREEGYGKELIKLNAKLVLKHPVVYLRCLFDMNSLVWEVAQPLDAYLWPVSLVPENAEIRYSSAHYLTNTICRAMDTIPLLKALFYRGGIAIFVLLCCSAIFVLHGKARYLFGILPAVFNSLLMMITIPAQDPRYVLPAMVCAIFYLTVLVSMRSGISNVEPKEAT